VGLAESEVASMRDSFHVIVVGIPYGAVVSDALEKL
jgi:hypothetical protein